ncbi:MAG: DoxX family protein [Candidatus Eremiobacteraeota bacterium]|nr:DoxX family protein [Candidatus Eremiobacteraeota bacterium]
MAYLIFALRIALGALLLVAGILKAHDGPAATATSIAGYRVLPPAIVAPLGVVLPYVEIVLGGYLVAGLFTRIAAILTSVQFAVFAGAVGSLVVRHLSADCGCFGSSVPTPPSWGHVAADVVLAAAAATIAWCAPGAFAVDRLLGTSNGGDPSTAASLDASIATASGGTRAGEHEAMPL